MGGGAASCEVVGEGEIRTLFKRGPADASTPEDEVAGHPEEEDAGNPAAGRTSREEQALPEGKSSGTSNISTSPMFTTPRLEFLFERREREGGETREESEREEREKDDGFWKESDAALNREFWDLRFHANP